MSEESRRRVNRIVLTQLAVGKSAREVAQEAGISERTVFRRLKMPGFRERVIELRQHLFDAATGQMADAATTAIGRLHALLTANSEHVQLGAARSILEQMLRLRDSVEFHARIVEVEELCRTKLRSRG